SVANRIATVATERRTAGNRCRIAKCTAGRNVLWNARYSSGNFVQPDRDCWDRAAARASQTEPSPRKLAPPPFATDKASRMAKKAALDRWRLRGACLTLARVSGYLAL